VLPNNEAGDDDLLDIFTKLKLSKPFNQSSLGETNDEQGPHKDLPKRMENS